MAEHLDDVTRTDRFVDALATGRPPDCNDPADRALAALMAGWRDELRSPPADGLVTEAEVAAAAAALHDGSARRRRPHRGLTWIGSAAATVLALGGFGAVVAGSQPGDALYGVRSALFGPSRATVDDQIVLTAKTELDKVQQMITQGQWDEAQQHLTSVGDTVQTVGDTQRRAELVDQWNRLNVQVQNRDPNAVPPPGAPQIAPSVTGESTTSVTLSVTPSTTPASTSTPSSAPATSTPASSSAAPTSSTAPTSTPSATSASTPPPSASSASSAVTTPVTTPVTKPAPTPVETTPQTQLPSTQPTGG